MIQKRLLKKVLIIKLQEKFDKFVENGLIDKLKHVVTTKAVRITHKEAIDILVQVFDRCVEHYTGVGAPYYFTFIKCKSIIFQKYYLFIEYFF